MLLTTLLVGEPSDLRSDPLVVLLAVVPTSELEGHPPWVLDQGPPLDLYASPSLLLALVPLSEVRQSAWQIY